MIFDYVPTLDDALRDELVRHWMAVNDADGAVGFRPGASYGEVAAALAKHERALNQGHAWLYTLRDDTGALVAFAFWTTDEHGEMSRHIATIKRLQVHPDHQGKGYGALMMDALHSPDVLNRLQGVDFLHLQYRAGRGLGNWYPRYGYTEIACYDLFRKAADGSYGGWREMLRTIDGSPLPAGAGL